MKSHHAICTSGFLALTKWGPILKLLFKEGVCQDYSHDGSYAGIIGCQNGNRNNTQTKIWKQNHLYFVCIQIKMAAMITQSKTTENKTCVLEKEI